MKAQHTAGPWTVEKPSAYVRPGTVTDSDGYRVAEAWGSDPKITEANARLIAAAPELLAVLKECQRQCWVGAKRRHQDPLLQQVKTALAKAGKEV